MISKKCTTEILKVYNMKHKSVSQTRGKGMCLHYIRIRIIGIEQSYH